MPKRRYDIQKVKEIFEQEGYYLLENSYKNNRTKMNYICPKGHRGTITLNNFLIGHRCFECSRDNIADKKRLTYEQVKKVFEDAGCTLLTESYKNTREKLVYKCKCGLVAESSYKNFIVSKQCKYCSYEQMSGSNHPNYNPNRTDKERKRSYRGYKAWVRSVLTRDNFTCRKCGESKEDMVAHHLDGHDWCEEKRLDVNNGVTLCRECHEDFHSIYGRGGNTKEQYEEWIGCTVYASA